MSLDNGCEDKKETLIDEQKKYFFTYFIISHV